MSSSKFKAKSVPIARLARFVNGSDGGQVELFEAQIDKLEYIAISHVWGAAEWLRVPGIEEEIRLSPRKAKWIETDLPDLVGNAPFWMDVVCIDQRDQGAVIGVAQDIPAIFRNAAKTIAVREGDGLYECCARLVTAEDTWEEVQQKLTKHGEDHFGQVYAESYLQRLWTLQECILSHTIEFVSCRTGLNISNRLIRLAAERWQGLLRTTRREDQTTTTFTTIH